jgi:hypothetical protein
VESAPAAGQLRRFWEGLPAAKQERLLARSGGDLDVAMRLVTSIPAEEVESAPAAGQLRRLWESLPAAEQEQLLVRTEEEIDAMLDASLKFFESVDRSGKSDKSLENPTNVESELYIGNAGLVILWQYLERFFDHLNLLDERHFTTPEAEQQGVLLLQLLATGVSELVEYQLPLNKVLCGLDPDALLDITVALPDDAVAQCDLLLRAVIDNTPSFGQISLDGLRGSFLLRDGVLRPRDGGWLLQVKRASYDIILEQVPWNLNVIRLPWMRTLIQVEW